MAKHKKNQDNWEKTRKAGHMHHFTREELGFIKTQFLAGVPVRNTAESLSAASRTISTHYQRLKGEGFTFGGVAIRKAVAKADYTARLYKPNFDL